MALQNWAADIIAILREARTAAEEARARGDTALDQKVLDDLLERYDTAAAFGRTHNRLRDWDTWNHPTPNLNIPWYLRYGSGRRRPRI